MTQVCSLGSLGSMAQVGLCSQGPLLSSHASLHVRGHLLCLPRLCTLCCASVSSVKAHCYCPSVFSCVVCEGPLLSLCHIFSACQCPLSSVSACQGPPSHVSVHLLLSVHVRGHLCLQRSVLCCASLSGQLALKTHAAIETSQRCHKGRDGPEIVTRSLSRPDTATKLMWPEYRRKMPSCCLDALDE